MRTRSLNQPTGKKLSNEAKNISTEKHQGHSSPLPQIGMEKTIEPYWVGRV